MLQSTINFIQLIKINPVIQIETAYNRHKFYIISIKTNFSFRIKDLPRLGSSVKEGGIQQNINLDSKYL